MILCFSGTGTSRLVARRLSAMLRDEITDLNALLKSGERPHLPSETPYVVVAPTYAWRLPRPVSDLLARLPLDKGRKAYFVLTCGGDIAGAAAHNRALAERMGLSYMGTASVLMPDNYIVMLSPPARERARQIAAASEPRIDEIGAVIQRGETLRDEKIGIGKRVQSGAVNVLFSRFAIRLKKFRATEKCTGCGWCARACPTNNIAMTDRRPAWTDRCMSCMGCINGCPEGAIEHGKRTVGKNRFYFK